MKGAREKEVTRGAQHRVGVSGKNHKIKKEIVQLDRKGRRKKRKRTEREGLAVVKKNGQGGRKKGTGRGKLTGTVYNMRLRGGTNVRKSRCKGKRGGDGGGRENEPWISNPKGEGQAWKNPWRKKGDYQGGAPPNKTQVGKMQRRKKEGANGCKKKWRRKETSGEKFRRGRTFVRATNQRKKSHEEKTSRQEEKTAPLRK